MACQITHPTGKPGGLSLAVLPLDAEPVAYLTLLHHSAYRRRPSLGRSGDKERASQPMIPTGRVTTSPRFPVLGSFVMGEAGSCSALSGRSCHASRWSRLTRQSSALSLTQATRYTYSNEVQGVP